MPFISGEASSNGETILTLPAGTSFSGSIALSGTLTAGINSSAATVMPSVTVEGTNAVPSDGAVISRIVLSTPIIGFTSLLGVTNGATAVTHDVYVEAPSGNSVNLVLNIPSPADASAVANGYRSS